MESIQDLSQPIIEIPPSDIMDVIQIILTNKGQNLLNPEINRIISEIETIHERFQKHNHVHVCNQISGFRQVAFTGAFLNTDLFRKLSNDLYILAVTDDGRLVFNFLKAENENIAPLVTIADALDVFINGKKGWTSKKINFRNLNFSENKIAFKKIIFTGYLLKINDLLLSLSLIEPEVTKIMSGLENRFLQGLRGGRGVKTISLIRSIGTVGKSGKMLPVTYVGSIINVLDTDVVQIMHDTDFKNIEYIRWLTGGDGESRTLIEARQQAIKTYPVLATEIFKSSDLRIVIDARTSLSRAIARKYKTDQHKVKRFQGLTWQQADHGDLYFPGSLSLFEILNMPEGMVPKTPDEFRKIDKMIRFAVSLYTDKTSGNKGIKLSIIMNYISKQKNFRTC